MAQCPNTDCGSPLDAEGICPICYWDGIPSKFEMGQQVMTSGVAGLMKTDLAFAHFCFRSLARHSLGDWGDLCKEDKQQNESSLVKGFRLVSAYEDPQHPKIWIITEADRSVTTVLFPDEY